MGGNRDIKQPGTGIIGKGDGLVGVPPFIKGWGGIKQPGDTI